MLNLKPTITRDDMCYLAALALVQQLEARLAYGRPIIDKSGQRLTTLEDVVQAILDDRIPESEDGIDS